MLDDGHVSPGPEEEFGRVDKKREQGGEKAVAERREKIPRQAILSDIREMETTICPQLESILLKEGVEIDKQELLSLVPLLSREIFKKDNYFALQKDPVVGAWVEHDLSNYAVGSVNTSEEVVKLIDNLPEGKMDPVQQEKLMRRLRIVLAAVRPFSFVLEDLLSRDRRGVITNLESHHRPLDMPALRTTIETVGKKLQTFGIMRGVEWEYDEPVNGLLREDEVIDTNPGVIVNTLINLLTNAYNDRVGADKVALKINREGEELVLTVTDTGRGMLPQHLDPETDASVQENGHPDLVSACGYVFHPGPGHSENRSTGLGLAYLPERLRSINSTLRVGTRRKLYQEGNNKEFRFYHRVDFSNSPERKLPDLTLADREATKFEIRVPITKHK